MVLTVSPGNVCRRHRSSGRQSANERPNDVLPKPANLICSRHADPAKIHYADYQGRWIRTRGPLPTPRSPQGRPVIMQAGSSERGREFAARWAEVIFTLQHSKADMQVFYSDIKT